MPCSKNFTGLKGYEWQNYNLIETYKFYSEDYLKKNFFSFMYDIILAMLSGSIAIILNLGYESGPVEFKNIIIRIVIAIGIFILIFVIGQIVKYLFMKLKKSFGNKFTKKQRQELYLMFNAYMISKIMLSVSFIKRIKEINNSDEKIIFENYCLELINNLWEVKSKLFKIFDVHYKKEKLELLFIKNYEVDKNENENDKIDIYLLKSCIVMSINVIKSLKNELDNKNKYISEDNYKILKGRCDKLLRDYEMYESDIEEIEELLE